MDFGLINPLFTVVFYDPPTPPKKEKKSSSVNLYLVNFTGIRGIYTILFYLLQLGDLEPTETDLESRQCHLVENLDTFEAPKRCHVDGLIRPFLPFDFLYCRIPSTMGELP